MKPARHYKIFISYAREDAQDVAIKLRNDLTAAGHQPWLDLAEIAAGASWAKDIEEAIENCDIALTLLSHGSYVSDICRAEQLRSLRKNKRVIPILVQFDADRPLHLEHLNFVDFSDPENYQPQMDGLVEYIETGYSASKTQPMIVPVLDEDDDYLTESRPLPPVQLRKSPSERKRDARAFRRYLTELREEPWLGERHWWTFFLFHYTDITDIAEILTTGKLMPPEKKKRFDRTVRFFFRPRTPDLFGVEGIRPEWQRTPAHMSIPAYLLFDMEGIITLAEARFSEGDLNQNKKTFKSALSFRDLPFDLIYHDTWLRSEERDEILNARRAQVILPDVVGLEHLEHIMCRSKAEVETLLMLLPDNVRKKWQPFIEYREDYNLFNARWTFVRSAQLQPEGAHFQFNPWDSTNNDEFSPFDIRAEIETNSHTHVIELSDVDLTSDELALDLTTFSLNVGYTLKLYLDEALAYAGQCGG